MKFSILLCAHFFLRRIILKVLAHILKSALVIAASFAVTAQAQTVATPASSVDKGGRAVIAITMPPPGVTEDRASEIAANTRDRGWSSYFIGSTRCLRRQCLTIGSDALVAGQGTTGYARVVLVMSNCGSVQGGQGTTVGVVARPRISPTDMSFGRLPTDWEIVDATGTEPCIPNV